MKSQFVSVLIFLAALNTASASDSLRCGDNVIADHQWPGRVLDVYKNGDALVVTNYQTSPYLIQTSHLSREASCVDRFCKTDSVIFDRHSIGSILKIFENGDALVITSFQSFPYVTDISRLAKEAQCIQGICKGDNILFNEKWEGTVIHIYKNGAAQVQTDFSSSPYITDASRLSHSDSCQNSQGCR